MRIPDGALDGVVFLCRDVPQNDGKIKRAPFGTAFYVVVPNECNPAQEKLALYVVTAHHNIEEPDIETIYVRINNDYRNEGGFVDVPTKKGDWKSHDDADVAAIHFIPPPSSEKIQLKIRGYVHVDSFVNADWQYRGRPFPKNSDKSIPLAVGDDVFFTGLFSQSAGKERNLPIARFGSIARKPAPKELIRLKGCNSTAYFDVEAYLVECRSWGGHSGSPTFWVAPGNRGIIGLLGLVSAHFHIEQEAKQNDEQKAKQKAGDIKMDINSGIAIVTPAWNIKELLMHPDFVEDRAGRDKP